jgi:hypothetical protein
MLNPRSCVCVFRRIPLSGAMGILAMSRAIGDLFLKPYVSAEPEVNQFALTAGDEFVVLASDGVYDVFDNDQVVRIVRSAASPQEAATLLTSSAFHAGSLDNVTAVVVALRGYKPRGRTTVSSVAEEHAAGPAGRFASSILAMAQKAVSDTSGVGVARLGAAAETGDSPRGDQGRRREQAGCGAAPAATLEIGRSTLVATELWRRHSWWLDLVGL